MSRKMTVGTAFVTASILLFAVCVYSVATAQNKDAEKPACENVPKFIMTDISGIEPEISRPAAKDVISGNSEFRFWKLDSLKEGVTFAVWESTPGKWKYTSPQWEYCRILSGVTVITEENGKSHTVKAGDSFLLKPGIVCTWDVRETTRKELVSYDF